MFCSLENAFHRVSCDSKHNNVMILPTKLFYQSVNLFQVFRIMIHDSDASVLNRFKIRVPDLWFFVQIPHDNIFFNLDEFARSRSEPRIRRWIRTPTTNIFYGNIRFWNCYFVSFPRIKFRIPVMENKLQGDKPRIRINKTNRSPLSDRPPYFKILGNLEWGWIRNSWILAQNSQDFWSTPPYFEADLAGRG